MHKQIDQSLWAMVSGFIGVERLPRSLAEKALCTIGAFVGILAVYFIAMATMEPNAAILIVASMGASAVLLFSLPHAAVSQPWPVFAGQVVSALVGVFVGKHVANPLLAAPLAVALCTVFMLLGKCLHPPGAASALTAVFATDGIREMGYSFALAPVALNAAILILIAFAFNAPFKGRRYPSGWRVLKPETDVKTKEKSALSHADLVKAVEDLDTFIDVSEDDLLQLHQRLSDIEATARH